jgi:hypothetical protein
VIYRTFLFYSQFNYKTYLRQNLRNHGSTANFFAWLPSTLKMEAVCTCVRRLTYVPEDRTLQIKFFPKLKKESSRINTKHTFSLHSFPVLPIDYYYYYCYYYCCCRRPLRHHHISYRPTLNMWDRNPKFYIAAIFNCWFSNNISCTYVHIHVHAYI